MTNDSLISVIIPVYKTEKYLDKCVSSVVNQTYRNLEIILVDDGSPDRCPEICDEWAKKDSRIRVIHKENGGAADAKNTGLDAATGDYIALVDSDDIIAPEMYRSLYDIMVSYNADIVDSLIKKIESYDEVKSDLRTYSIKVYTAEEALSLLIHDKTVRQTPVNKLYKRSVISDIRFPKGKYIDDEYWTYKVIGKTAKYVFTEDVFYYYLQHSESAMCRDYSLKRLDVLDALEERLEYVSTNYTDLIPDAVRSYFGSCRFHFQMLCFYNDLDHDKKYRKGILVRISRIVSRYNVETFYHGKQKIWTKSFIKAPYLTSRIRNIFKIGW